MVWEVGLEDCEVVACPHVTSITAAMLGQDSASRNHWGRWRRPKLPYQIVNLLFRRYLGTCYIRHVHDWSSDLRNSSAPSTSGLHCNKDRDFSFPIEL
jgi:hypothetical protein